MSDGTVSDVAEMLDNFVEWFAVRWRAMFYSFLAGALFTLACSV